MITMFVKSQNTKNKINLTNFTPRSVRRIFLDKNVMFTMLISEEQCHCLSRRCKCYTNE